LAEAFVYLAGFSFLSISSDHYRRLSQRRATSPPRRVYY